MSDKSDSSLARHDSQAKSGDKLTSVNLDDPLYQAQLRYFTAFAAIGEHFLAFITGEVFIQFAARCTHLARASFIPASGHGNTSAVAFLLGMKESGARDLAIRRNLPVVKPGEERIYQFSDIPKEFAHQEKQQDSVAPVKLKRIRNRKKSP